VVQQVVVDRFGGPEVLVPREAPDPVAGPGEVVVAVRAADVLWLETMVRRGDGRGYWPMTPPYVPGNAVVGHVLSVGDDVDPGWVGRAVATETGGTGGYAERVVVPAAGLTPVPDGLALEDAAVVDSGAPGWVDEARAALGSAGATVVLDNIGGEVGEAAFALVAPGGRFSAHGTPSGRFAQVDQADAERRGITVTGIGEVQLSPEERLRLTARALAEAAAGRIRPLIGQTYRLARAADAHAGIEARTVFGKTLLLVPPRVS
jgi:NADPH:quinone reductase